MDVNVQLLGKFASRFGALGGVFNRTNALFRKIQREYECRHAKLLPLFAFEPAFRPSRQLSMGRQAVKITSRHTLAAAFTRLEVLLS
ncbi:MAG: hypothetical protein WAU59_11735, partial [Rhodoplanes sp.]